MTSGRARERDMLSVGVEKKVKGCKDAECNRKSTGPKMPFLRPYLVFIYIVLINKINNRATTNNPNLINEIKQ